MRPILALSVAVLAASPLAAATFRVDSTMDTSDASAGDGTCATSQGACTLRAAIEEANALLGTDRIELPSGTYSPASTLTIAADADIVGGGVTTPIIDGSGLPFDSILTVPAGASASLEGVELSGGLSAISNEGNLTLTRTSIVDNVQGVSNSGGTLAVMSSLIAGNVCPAIGGGCQGAGIAHFAGTLTVSNSLIARNVAGNEAAGIFSTGTTTLVNTTISDNEAANGAGGLKVAGGSTTLLNVTIANNRADTADRGGFGGGVWRSAGDLMVRNSIIAGNADVGTIAEGNDCFGFITSLEHSLLQDTVDCSVVSMNGAITGMDPLLGPLADHGGPTDTHSLLAGSPAIDAGDPNGCADADGGPLTSDQRGAPRPFDGDADGVPVCDMGAVEFVPEPSLVLLQLAALGSFGALAFRRRMAG